MKNKTERIEGVIESYWADNFSHNITLEGGIHITILKSNWDSSLTPKIGDKVVWEYHLGAPDYFIVTTWLTLNEFPIIAKDAWRKSDRIEELKFFK